MFVRMLLATIVCGVVALSPALPSLRAQERPKLDTSAAATRCWPTTSSWKRR